MLDRDTVIQHPHSPDDPRISVTMEEDGARLILFFPPENGFTGLVDPTEVRLLPQEGKPFLPDRLLPRLPLHRRYAKASLAWRHDDIVGVLRQLHMPRRGRGAKLTDDFLQLVAIAYEEIVGMGEPHPVKAIANMEGVDISTASRWVSAARLRGYLAASVDDAPAAAPTPALTDEQRAETERRRLARIEMQAKIDARVDS
jgi:hypothetical protein